MAKFECNWCGKCCVSFGEFIRVERQLTQRDYYCRFGITNELFQVHVLPEYADVIDDAFSAMEEQGKDYAQKGCMFMQKNPDGPGFACAIYPTRPTICREFLCYRMVIYDQPSGEIRGRVIGINELRSKDEVLSSLWKEKIASLPHPFVTQQAAFQHNHRPAEASSHGHDSHLSAHIYGAQHGDDQEWVANVITILAAHGYHADPVVA